jgi:putative ABC transport system permease protein
MAVSYLRRPTTRHRFAVAALVCAIGMAAGMAILIASFESSIRGWIEQSLQADLYVAARAAKGASAANRISPATVQRIAGDPAIARINARVYQEISIDGLPTALAGIDLADPAVRAAFRWIEAPATGTADAPQTTAFVTESFADRFRRHRGDQIHLLTPDGEKTLTVAGVYSDYSSERGILTVDRATVQRWFHDDAVTHLSISLKPGAAANEVRERWMASYPGLTIFENSSLRKQILEVFRETFSVTYALEVIGVVVAISSLAISLASVLLDRRDQLTTLRAIGFRRSELAWSACGEGVVIAISAVAGGLTLSVALGWLLIFVINKQSFGWTLGYVVPQLPLGLLGVTTIVVSAVVSYAVGRWGASLPADREE